MPGSLLSPPRSRVARNESTRSDHSDGSNTSQSSAAGKKVSFNKAVRVKKYGKPKKSAGNGDLNGTTANGVTHVSGSPEKRFWFKVYKNKHRQSPDPKELRSNGVIYYNNDPSGHVVRHFDDDVISYHPNPSSLNYPVLTAECATQTPPRESGSSAARLRNEYTPLHPSQVTEPPNVERNHVKKIVNRFNEEAVLTRQRYSDGEMSPPGSPPSSPKYHSTPMKAQRIPTPPPEPPLFYDAKVRSEGTSKSKKNPIVNGVKVIFGMTQLKKKGKTDSTELKSPASSDYKVQETVSSDTHVVNGKSRGGNRYKTEITVSDGSETEVKARNDDFDKYKPHNGANGHGELVKRSRGGLFRHNENDSDNFDDFFRRGYDDDDEDYSNRRGKVHVETYDSGNQLVFDTTDVNTASTKLEKGELFSTVGEKHQLWQNNKRIIVYEEPSPRIIRRKAKSHSDLLNSEEEFKTKVDKGVSTEHLSSRKVKNDTFKKNKDSSWLRVLRLTTKDKGVQCSKVPTSEFDEEIYAYGKYKLIKPRSVGVSTYCDERTLEKLERRNRDDVYRDDDYNTSAISSSYQNGDIYSQVDKSKKRRDAKKKNYAENDGHSTNLFKSRSEPLYIGPPPKDVRNAYDGHSGTFYEEDGDRTIKTSKRSFGFRLSPGRENSLRKGSRHQQYQEENWYEIDEDVKAAEKSKSRGSDHHDMSEIREEIANEDYTSDLSINDEHRKDDVGIGSVIREVDYKKREISYENVPRSDGENNANATAAASSGLWFLDADEDYRKEMAQSEVSYPAGNHVGSDRFYTVSRTDRASKQKPPPSPRAFTLDRRHFKDKKKVSNSTGVKILVNGKEISEASRNSKKNKSHRRKSRITEDPSSVQSDPLYVRGGLAAAYQARQRAAVRRSNSSVAGIGADYRTSPAGRRRYRGTSEASGASSETESARARRPLVMYIPGISHYEKSPEEGDRSSGVNVARSQSMMTSSRPSKISSRSKSKSSKTDLYRNAQLYEEDEIMPLASDSSKKKPPKVPHDSKKSNDIKRRHSMPKDTKFSWLKWKIRGKPSREP